ncbi:MAG: ATP-binding protein, partial [Vicinamibacteria bacterium]
LDGLPLAIELAAARIGVMSPRTMLGRMSERFKLLASSRGRTDRQAALRATFDWSWDLLTAAEKSTLAQLSVFEGGFTLDAAEAVVDVAALDDAPWPADLVQSLLHKSLVRKVDDDRFDLLVSVREYAAGQLVALGGAAAKTGAEQRHGAYYAALDERAIVDGQSVELDNLVAACRRAVARGDGDIAVGTLACSWAALASRGPYRVAVDLAAQVRGITADATALRARVGVIAGDALIASGASANARETLEAALADARAAGDRRSEVEALTHLGRPQVQALRTQAVTVLDEALALAHGDLEQQSRILQYLGQHAHYSGASDTGRARLGAALDLARRLGNRRHEGRILCDLGVLCADAGPMGDAHAFYQGALEAARATDDRSNVSLVLSNLGLLLQLEGRYDEAVEPLDAALALCREAGYVRVEPVILCNMGIVCDKRGEPEQARRHYEAALEITRANGHRRTEGQVLGYLGALHARLGETGAARECLDRATEALEAVDDAMSLGIVHCLRAEAEHRAGRSEAARAALREAEAAAAAIGTGEQSEFGLELARVRALIG